MIASYPFDVDYEVGDLIVIGHPIEFMGMSIKKGEVGIVTFLYDRSYAAHNIYDCVIVLKCGYTLDCWFGELINLTKLT